MPIQGYNTRIIIDQYELSGVSNQLTLTIDATAIEYNVFQEAAKVSIPGAPTVALEHNGYFTTPAVGELERTIYDRLGVSCQVAAILGTNQPIPVAYVIPDAFASLLNIDSPVSELITVNGAWPVATGQLYRGYQLWHGLINAIGPQAGVNFGAAGASGGKAWLFVTTIAGTATNATITVQTDDNAGFTSATTQGTFTFSSAGDRAFGINLTAAEQYMRVNATSLGGATSFTVNVIAGVAGRTY